MMRRYFSGSKPVKRSLQFGIGFCILALGVLVVFVLVKTKKAAPHVEREEKHQVVETIVPKVVAHVPRITAHGVIEPARIVAIKPEVAGRIVYKNKNLIPGGVVKKGDLLVRIDEHEYKLRVDQQRAQVTKAQLELRLEKARAQVAKRDIERLGDIHIEDEQARQLAERKPFVDSAHSALLAAKSNLELAKLQLERTRIYAPFNALIKRETVEIGALVSQAFDLATLIGTDSVRAKVTLPIGHVSFMQLPDANGAGGAKAVVMQQTDVGRAISREGRVIRLLGELDPLGHMAQLLIEISDPLRYGEGDQLPLLPGAQVVATVFGRAINNVVRVARGALSSDGVLWVVDGAMQLQKRHIEVVWRDREDLYVRNGFAKDDQIVVRGLLAAIEGATVRIKKQPSEVSK